MQVREGQERPARKRASRIEEPRLRTIYPNQEAAERDLGKHLQALFYLPGVELQVEGMVANLNEVLDDEVLASLEEMLELAIFREVEEGDLAFTLRLKPAHEHIKQLRILQKARLRDGLYRLLSQHSPTSKAQ